MTTSTYLPLADTSEMIGLHRVFRDALESAPSFVGRVEEGDIDRAELVGSYYTNVLDLLHSHHQGEDELLTPRLLERMPDHTQTITRVGQQHQGVLLAVDHAAQTILAWRAAPTAANREDALAALAALSTGLTPHLDEEEHEILPLAAQCINVAEWGELPEHGMRSFRGDKLWLIIGLIQERMSDAQKANMQAHMPTPVLELWNGPGQAMFGSFIAELRG